MRASALLSLEASATLAACFAGADIQVNFTWNNTAARPLTAAAAPSPPLLALPTASERDLPLDGAALLPGVKYTLQVRGSAELMKLVHKLLCGLQFCRQMSVLLPA